MAAGRFSSNPLPRFLAFLSFLAILTCPSSCPSCLSGLSLLYLFFVSSSSQVRELRYTRTEKLRREHMLQVSHGLQLQSLWRTSRLYCNCKLNKWCCRL